MTKLNLGSGHRLLDGWVNVDCVPQCEPDYVCDLESETWPWEDGSVDEVLFNHALEHMGETVAGFWHVMAELYRVCRDDATVQINVPHPRHDDFLNDPTHVRVITPELLGLLDRERCAWFRENGAANTPLGDYWGVNFKTEKVGQVLDPAYEHWRGDQNLAKMIVQFNNVIKEYQITLRVVKS